MRTKNFFELKNSNIFCFKSVFQSNLKHVFVQILRNIFLFWVGGKHSSIQFLSKCWTLFGSRVKRFAHPWSRVTYQPMKLVFGLWKEEYSERTRENIQTPHWKKPGYNLNRELWGVRANHQTRPPCSPVFIF